MYISDIFYKKSVAVLSADQHPPGPHGAGTEENAEENIDGGGKDFAVLNQEKSFVGKGGKGGEAAAEADLQKQDPAGVGAAVFPGKGDDKTDEKSAEDVDAQSDKGKSFVRNGQKAQKIAAYRTQSAAAAHSNAVPDHEIPFLSVKNKKADTFTAAAQPEKCGAIQNRENISFHNVL